MRVLKRLGLSLLVGAIVVWAVGGFFCMLTMVDNPSYGSIWVDYWGRSFLIVVAVIVFGFGLYKVIEAFVSWLKWLWSNKE